MTAAFAPVSPAAAGVHPPGAPRGRLALLLQEALTVIVRLRAGRQQVADAVAFRGQVVHQLQRAKSDALALGYAADDVELAIFGVVALLDESALNARQPSLAEWAKYPLQMEMYREHLAGERFFEHVDRLLARPDSAALADVLEVQQLVLLLGFRGRYGQDAASLLAVSQRVGERLARLTGAEGSLAPAWRPPADGAITRDPWIRPLKIALAVSAVLVVVLWGAGVVSLRGAAADVRALASGPPVALGS